MEIAALIISTLALILSIICISIMLAKNFFSTHQVQMVPIDPFKDSVPGQAGVDLMDQFRDLGDPIDSEEMERLELLRQKKGKMT